MADIEIIPYSPDHDAQIRILCRLPVSGKISLSLEREPNYFTGAAVQCNRPEIYVCRRRSDNLILGVFNVGFRNVYYKGREVRIRYLCDLRIHPDEQGGSLLFRMIRFVEQLKLSRDGLPAQTIVFGDNEHMLNMIKRSGKSASRQKLPTYHYAGKYITTLLGFNNARSVQRDLQIRRAEEADLPDIQKFIDAEGKKINYFPVYRLKQLKSDYYKGIDLKDYFVAIRDNRIVGICGVWDQSGFKQTRIVEYSAAYNVIRPFYNLWALVQGGSTLPPPGSILKYLNLHTILIKDRDPDIFEDLVQVILKEYRRAGYDYLLCGLDANDPLMAVYRSFKHRREIVGRYFLVNHFEEVPESVIKPWFYLEAGRI